MLKENNDISEQSNQQIESHRSCLSQILVSEMKKRKLSVNKLAKLSNVSPTIVQDLRTAKKSNITLQTLIKILDVIDFEINYISKKEN